ncbi:unnamed protein product, partial [Bubo scandiacus]
DNTVSHGMKGTACIIKFHYPEAILQSLWFRAFFFHFLLFNLAFMVEIKNWSPKASMDRVKVPIWKPEGSGTLEYTHELFYYGSSADG